MAESAKSCINIFVKFPQAGKVKTRLAAEIGQRQAAHVYRFCVEDLLERLRKIDIDQVINFSPPQQDKQIKKWLTTAYNFTPQKGYDLGSRMKNAFVHSFSCGYENVIIIGSDNPDIPLDFFSRAFAALNSKGAVIGPDNDGGYYLIGFTKASFCPAVFDNINWSTPAVFNETCEKLKMNSVQYQVLPFWKDIDTVDDLAAFMNRQRENAVNCRRTYDFVLKL